MDSTYDPTDCPSHHVCRCLQVTEDEVVTAILTLGITNLRQLRRCTGAGEGCTSCHRDLERLIEERAYPSASALPICSVK